MGAYSHVQNQDSPVVRAGQISERDGGNSTVIQPGVQINAGTVLVVRVICYRASLWWHRYRYLIISVRPSVCHVRCCGFRHKTPCGVSVGIFATLRYLHCALASCGAVYCNRSCLWVGGWVHCSGKRVQQLKKT